MRTARGRFIIEKDGEYLKMVNTSHDDWALDDFGAWCEEYISRALKSRVIGRAEIRENAPMRLKKE